jgi:uncharacterized protein YbjT (DUF2867 family)
MVAAIAAASVGLRAASADARPHNTDHLITGPEALSYADAADIITDTVGRVVRHHSVSTAEMTARFADRGLPPEYAAMLAGLDEDIRHGAEDRVTSTVPDVSGRPARSFAEFVSAHRSAFTG